VQEINPVIHRARVARLAIADSITKPHIVPVVFAFDGKRYFIPIDRTTRAS
jgi:nitroimidazol reductase NimA-like FMN-containing flavoprotein (pyridoxamine 5'-phosphate oxidase superfamily)